MLNISIVCKILDLFWVKFDFFSSINIYEQVKNQFTKYISSGQLFVHNESKFVWGTQKGCFF